MPVSDRNNESGFTMVVTLVAMSVIMMLAVVAVTAVNGDSRLSRRDLERKQAYEAAKSGVEEYAFHLKVQNNYWESCYSSALNSPVNPQGSTERTRTLPGTTGTKYALELLPAVGQTRYTQCSTSAPGDSMIEQSGAMAGSFRIRSTGFAGKAKASIVATFKRPSFLDYVYFTQFETMDPITYAKSTWLKAAYERCEKTIQEGRYTSEIPGSSGAYCSVISFADNELIKGPLHTNDALVVCGEPVFGRSSSDSIEVGASTVGWYAGTNSTLGQERPSSTNCPSATPVFKGNFKINAGVLKPPETNSELSTIAESGYKFTGQIQICLSGTQVTFSTTLGSCTGTTKAAIPPNGVIYVSNSTGCDTSYSPFTAKYEAESPCGNVFVKGSYSGQLTIAAENDIVINGNLENTGTNGLLGLIANNFVRVYNNVPTQTSSSNCGSDSNAEGISNLKIAAAILAINHSFIVDHYNCGDVLGTLTLKGAIGQKFRGPVGTFSSRGASSGYTKNYEYDDRLRYAEPPSFLDPITKSWVIGRETNG
jgi:type II secretory pathway pseudopilin PulG